MSKKYIYLVLYYLKKYTEGKIKMAISMGYIEGFFEIYNAGAAFIIIFLIGQIIFIMRRVDKDVLKARLFLDSMVMHRTWMYISVSGAAFALNTLVKFVIRFTSNGRYFEGFYIVEMTQLIFLISFIMAVYSWNVFMKGVVCNRYIGTPSR